MLAVLILELLSRERLAVVVTSPMMPEKQQFVCAPGIHRATGRAQADGAIEGLRDLGIFDYIVGVTYNTTPSNSSPAVGTVALLEEEIGQMLVKLACRHHIYDLFGKNLRNVVVGRKTSGPGHPIFLKLAKEWPSLVDVIDYDSLVTLDMAPWVGTFVERVVNLVKVWCISTFANVTFDRGSYKDLLLSIMKYLDVQTNPPIPFKFRAPKPVSNARFGEPAQYYLDLALLSGQLPWLTPAQREEVKTMAFICAVFYGPGFLKSAVGIDAAYNDLTSILHYRQLRPFMPRVAAEALATFNRHLDYITPQNIVLALVCDKFSVEQRERLARALLSLLPNRVRALPPSRVSYPGPNFTLSDTFWPEDNTLPDISQFVTGESFLIFNILKTTDEDLTQFLSSSVDTWDADPDSPNFCSGFAQLRGFGLNTHFVNDPAER